MQNLPCPYRNDSLLPESTGGYRYGFNGGEQVSCMSGASCYLDAGFRYLNCNLGRFISIDPKSKAYPWQSGYAFAANTVIMAIDELGLGPIIINGSPQQAMKMKAALEMGDYAEAYRILSYALSNGFVDDNQEPSSYMQNRIEQELGLFFPDGTTAIDGGAFLKSGVVIQGIVEGEDGLQILELGELQVPFDLRSLHDNVVLNPRSILEIAKSKYEIECTSLKSEIEILEKSIAYLEGENLFLKDASLNRAAQQVEDSQGLAENKGKAKDGEWGATFGRFTMELIQRYANEGKRRQNQLSKKSLGQ